MAIAKYGSVFLWSLFACTVVHAQSQPIQLSGELFKKVGALYLNSNLNSRTCVGSCFYVDERGYIATCLTNLTDLRGGDKLTVFFYDGMRFDVDGIVAASVGKDIAIAKISPAKRGVPRSDKPLDLMRNANPGIDDDLAAWGGPFSDGFENWLAPIKVKRRLLGEEYVSGLEIQPSERYGLDPETMWIWLSHFAPRTLNGCPVFNREGQVVGMMSGSLCRGPTIFTAIHIMHVKDLIPDEDDPKLESFRAIRGWLDAVPQAQSPEAVLNGLESTWSGLGGLLKRGMSLDKRFEDWQDRIVKVEQEKAQIEQLRTKYQSDNLELQAHADKIQSELDLFRPEERTATSFRFSIRQVTDMKLLRDEITQIRKSDATKASEYSFAIKIRDPFVKGLHAHLGRESFFLADPLNLRSKKDHQDIELAVSKVIDDGGASAEVYLARALTRLNLGDNPGVLSDLSEVSEVDAKFQKLLQTFHSLSHVVQGLEKRSTEFKLSKEQEADPRILTLAARIDLESGFATAAVKKLKIAAKLAPNELEIEHGLAWLLSASPAANPKLAIEVASKVVQKSAGRDWSSLAALAAAYGLASNYDKAIEEIDSAWRIAPTTGQELCEGWKKQLQARQPIQREWKIR